MTSTANPILFAAGEMHGGEGVRWEYWGKLRKESSMYTERKIDPKHGHNSHVGRRINKGESNGRR